MVGFVAPTIGSERVALALAFLAIGFFFATGVLSIYCTRSFFGGYLRRIHPQAWNRLVGNAEIPTRGVSDVSSALADFRRRSTDDLGDPELARRRRIANRMEWMPAIVFMTGVLGILAAGALDYFLRVQK